MGRPQRLAAFLLLILLAECSWVIAHQTLTSDDFRYARCGREMWERPSPLAGYFTTCGNLNGDGTFAYRAAGLPLTLDRLVLLAADHLRAPANRLYTGTSLSGSTWESRHEFSYIPWLMHLPFVGFALWLGGGLWWVARRLFGNLGGALALLLYCFNPQVIRLAVRPNNEVLAMWGLYGLIYTAIGVAHALQGPRRKWPPRILLLSVSLGLTAAAHLLAAMVGFVAAVILMFYLAERRRSAVLLIAIYAAVGALVIEFAAFSFRLQPFTYVFTGGAGRFWFSLDGALGFVRDAGDWPLLAGAAIALFFYVGVRRSRYFGNTVPLVMTLLIAFLVTTQVRSAPWFWALPFLITFISGVFADLFEIRQRRVFLAMAAFLVLGQAAACLGQLPGIALGKGM
jgi:hypothetical protein